MMKAGSLHESHLWIKVYSRSAFDFGLDVIDQSADIRRGGVADVLDPVGVFPTDHGSSDPAAFQPGLLDPPPCAIRSGRGFKGAPGRRFVERLFVFPLPQVFQGVLADGGGIPRFFQFETGAKDHPVTLEKIGMAVTGMDVGHGMAGNNTLQIHQIEGFHNGRHFPGAEVRKPRI
jgi:hypothetical protein